MRHIVLTLVLIIALGTLGAQTATTWQYVRHSALDASGNVHVRFNGVPDVAGNYSLNYYQSNAWQELIPTSPETLLYEALVPAQTGQPVSYRVKSTYDAMGQQIIALNPTYYPTDAFPPTLASMSYVADDPVGDSVMVYYPGLDITGTWCGYSENKIYAAISNQTNSFTTMNSFSSYNMYFAGLVNAATALTDSTIYAMVYTFSIPGVISPGLYKFGMNVADTSLAFQRLGNVQSQVVGGKLMLACNISDLTADPSFGAWPPDFNAMGCIAGTVRIDLDLSTMTPAFNFGDYSAVGQMIFEHYNYTLGANSVPAISGVTLTGNAITRTLSLTYNDANADFPLTAKFVQDNGNEIALTPETYDFSQPVTFGASFTANGWTNGTIRFSDNDIDFITYEVANTAVEDDALLPTFSLNVAPNPYRLSAGLLSLKLNTEMSLEVTGGIYNLKGQCIRHLDLPSGMSQKSLTWDGLNSDGKPVADGVYFIQLHQGTASLSHKIMILK